MFTGVRGERVGSPMGCDGAIEEAAGQESSGFAISAFQRGFPLQITPPFHGTRRARRNLQSNGRADLFGLRDSLLQLRDALWADHLGVPVPGDVAPAAAAQATNGRGRTEGRIAGAWEGGARHAFRPVCQEPLCGAATYKISARVGGWRSGDGATAGSRGSSS